MVQIRSDREFSKDEFTFTFSAGPSLKFAFDRPVTHPIVGHQSFKRRRALSDVDGDGNEGRKKRRLRLHLITSRLSRPFSQPATNIVDHGISKIAVWAKNKSLTRGSLRKAAIMNRVRMRIDAAKDSMRQERERTRDTMALRQVVVQKPRYYDLPLPPSPLGLSNYDALDLEDEFEDALEDSDGGERSRSAIYSDFNIMNPMADGDGDNYDYLEELDLPGFMVEQTPPPPPEDRIVEILREKERQRDVYFVQLGG